MKKLILTSLLACSAFVIFAQDAALRVAPNGFVGINQNNPTQRLEIKDLSSATPGFLVNAVNGGGTTDNFMKAVGGTNGSAFFFNNPRFFAITPGVDANDVTVDWANSLVLYGATAANAGNVGIGVQNPTEKLHVNGNVLANNVAVPSDRRLKNNIQNFDYGLKEVLQLNPVTYNYNGVAGIIDRSGQIGIVAQELQKVVPELVGEFTYQTMEQVSLGDNPPKVLKEEQFLKIKDSQIKYLLINAIKDQQQIIEEKEARIASLEEKMAKIEEFMSTIGANETINVSEISLSTTDVASMEQNRPNPFNGQTIINYTIPKTASSAAINVFSKDGKLLREVAIGHVGNGELVLKADNLPAGTYTYQLVVDGKTIKTNQMIHTR